MGLANIQEAEAVYIIYPLWINPIEGIITSLGGLRYNPVTRRREFHDGIDIAAPVGTVVMAPKNGVVTAVGYSATWGRFVQLAHDGGYVSFMAHLNKVIVMIGDAVVQGQQIAYSGNTGRSTGPHLHFGLFRDGQFVDPFYYVDLPVSAYVAAPLS